MSEEEIRKIIQDELSYFIKNDKYVFSRLVQFMDGRNIQAGKTTGTKFGTATDQKIGFYNKTVVQAAAITAPTGGMTVDSEARTAIDSVRTALTNIGITA